MESKYLPVLFYVIAGDFFYEYGMKLSMVIINANQKGM